MSAVGDGTFLNRGAILDLLSSDERYRGVVADYLLAHRTCGDRLTIDIAHLARQREWSERTFGPGPRVGGIVKHIRKELDEITANPTDVEEWIDVVILALDGAWRAGSEPQQIINALIAKQAKNEARTWPDWRTLTEDDAIEHEREAGA